jgi:two-component system response regulator LytT
MRIAILEDEILVSDMLSTIIERNGFDTLAIAETIKDAKEIISLQPDLFFVDIRLGENENGIDFGSFLHEKGIPFIYVTANNEIEVMREAVITQPEAYITKPFNEKDVVAAIQLYALKKQSIYKLTIITPKGNELISENQILFCEADGVYTKLYTINKVITQRIKLKDLLEKLSDNFIRVHRSYIINKTKVTSFKSSNVKIGTHEIPVARTYRSVLKNL